MKISTAEIKNLLKTCTADGGSYTPQDFYRYIRQHTEKEFTKGQVAGAVAQLVDKGDLVNIERGLYKSGLKNRTDAAISVMTSGNSPFAAEIGMCLERTKRELSQIVEKVDILNMRKDEFELLGEIKSFNEILEVISAKCR